MRYPNLLCMYWKTVARALSELVVQVLKAVARALSTTAMCAKYLKCHVIRKSSTGSYVCSSTWKAACYRVWESSLNKQWTHYPPHARRQSLWSIFFFLLSLPGEWAKPLCTQLIWWSTPVFCNTGVLLSQGLLSKATEIFSDIEKWFGWVQGWGFNWSFPQFKRSNCSGKSFC